MSKLIIDQRTIEELFSNAKTDILIPDYQRPYAWNETQCKTLWDDIYSFSMPENNPEKFNAADEYFLGPIVLFKNNSAKQEIIDGQQRLTTLMLLLRAFYARLKNMEDSNSTEIKKRIEKCIWKQDEIGNIIETELKIDSEVATDEQKEEFLLILKNGDAPKTMKSRYAENYRLFVQLIHDFLNKFPSYFAYLPARLLRNCILLPIEAESQDTALRIFSTLNDRGIPLSDSDIFKAQFYGFYKSKGKKEDFITKWKELEKVCNKIVRSNSGNALDELFTRYMYFERAKLGIRTSTTEALRKFYEKDAYGLLKREETFDNLLDLADFWNDVSNQNKNKFSESALKKLFVLNYAPNGMWYYFVSVYYLQNRDANGNLDDGSLCLFLDKTIAFIWTYAIINPGVNMLRPPIYAEMINIVNNNPVNFADYKFETKKIENALNNFGFSNGRPITKAMLAWWAFQNNKQKLLPLEKKFEVEHIFPKNRQKFERSLKDENNLEVLGNKSFLEQRINIRASDYRFKDKIEYYKGYKKNDPTEIYELFNLGSAHTDFTESDIVERNKRILNTFLDYIAENGLIK